MSTTFPVSPSTPHELPPSACFALSLVNTRIGLAPAFWMRVRGMTSMASAMALYGHCATPSTDLAFWASRTDTAISVAPPPGESRGWNKTFLATLIASWRLRSISLRMSLLGPRSRMVQAFGFLHLVRNVKYSSPIFSISKSPHPVPTSDSCRSSTRFTIVAPTARATLLVSDFLTLRRAVTFALTK